MQPKSLLLLILALGCGLVAAIGITQVMANRNGGEQAAANMQSIFVALDDIPMGTLIDAQLVKLEEWPTDKIPEGALSRYDEIEGRRPMTRIFAGEALLDAKLLKKGEGNIASDLIPKGYRVVPVKVNEESGGAAMILPGDRVDLIVYVRQGKDVRQTMTKTILQDIKIFAVDDVWTMEQTEGGQTIRAKTISLLLTPKQTERVMMATELGRIRLALRSPEDRELAETDGLRASEILGNPDKADRDRDDTLEGRKDPPPVNPILSQILAAQAKAQTPAVKEKPAEEPEKKPSVWVVRTIQGSEVSEVVMTLDDEPAPRSTRSDSTSPRRPASRSSFWRLITNPRGVESPAGESKSAEPRPAEPLVPAKEPKEPKEEQEDA